MNPIVSIILPTYKDASRIAIAIQSVQRQSFSDWELIVVDDGLSDDPKSLVTSYSQQDKRIIYLPNNGNLGIQKSLNNGIKAAQGKYIARIDDDDEWIFIDKLRDQVEFLERNPDYGLLGTSAVICNEHGDMLAEYSIPTTDADIRPRMLSRNCFLHPTVMIRKETLDQAGGYREDESVRHVEDYELWLRLGTLSKFANLPNASTRLTIHSDSLTFKNRLSQARKALILVRQYRNQYQHFLKGYSILLVRVIGFFVLKYIPFPTSLLYKIQKIYKQS